MILSYLKQIKFTYFGLWFNYYLRKKKLKKIINNIKFNFPNFLDIENEDKIDRLKGYKILNYPNIEEIDEVINFCKTKYSIEYVIKNNKNSSKGGTLNIVDVDLKDINNKIIRDFCQNQNLIKIISNYLNEIPILFNVQVWFSPNQISNELLGSQLYHFDREDFRQLKLFIPIEDIDKDSGPLTLISSKNSMKFILKKLINLKLISSKGRFTDKEIKKYFKEDIEISLECKRRQIAMIDTTQCLHYGSRPSKKYKYHLSIQFISPYSTKLDKISKNFAKISNPEDLILYNMLNKK